MILDLSNIPPFGKVSIGVGQLEDRRVTVIRVSTKPRLHREGCGEEL